MGKGHHWQPRNAYIQIALMGTNFCVSAKKAFFLILRNAFRFGTVAILGAPGQQDAFSDVTGHLLASMASA